MSASADVTIRPVPSTLIRAMWPHVLPHVERGFKAAALDVIDLARDLATDRAALWCIFHGDMTSAAFFTSVHEDGGERFVFVYGLGGTGVRCWGSALARAMESHARANGCNAVRFMGRPAWARVLPGYRTIAERDGVALYERALG
jgi:hypothetical protein